MTSSPWNPPSDADPRDILDQAVDDRKAERYALALAKHEWIHHHSIELDPSFNGVRLSFALNSWRMLGDRHDPAKVALRSLRDEAESVFHQSNCSVQAFKELAALNLFLQREENTVEVFIAIEKCDIQCATRLYRTAEKYLAAAGQLSLCGRYVNPNSQLREALESYLASQEVAANVPELTDGVCQSAEQLLAKKAAVIIAILVHNGRDSEASEIRDRVRSKIANTSNQRMLVRALYGGIAP